MKSIVIKNAKNISDKELSDRASKMKRREQTVRLTELEHSVQFLNGVLSKASFLLPAYYAFFATNIDAKKVTTIEGYPGAVFQCYTKHSSLSYISLVVRKLFDHSNGLYLNGARFSKTSDQSLKRHAERWSSFSGRPKQDAFNALKILRVFFKICSQETNQLLKHESKLCKRIGLVKQYASREAAHLTFQDYEFCWLDIFHITASIVLVAEIVRSFDRPEYKESYYNNINKAAFSAIKELYPEIPEIEIFKKIKIAQMAKYCVEKGEDYFIDFLLEKIPDSLCYYWDPPLDN